MSNPKKPFFILISFIIFVFFMVIALCLRENNLERFVKSSLAEYLKNQKEYQINDGAVIVMDPKTLKILAKAGSFYDPHVMGSIFKPVLYAAAFEKGYKPDTEIIDEAVNFSGYMPRNFDDKYLGKITVKKALAQSRNIPAVKTYFFIGGQKEFISMARRMGIVSLQDDFDYGPSLALGSAKISLIELMRAYAVLAAGGFYKETKVLDGKIVQDLSDILADDNEKLGNSLKIPGKKVSVKTGTASTTKDDYVTPSDVWTIGYTDEFVVGVWLGNKEGKALKENADGVNNAGPLWNIIMTKLLFNYAVSHG